MLKLVNAMATWTVDDNSLEGDDLGTLTNLTRDQETTLATSTLDV